MSNLGRENHLLSNYLIEGGDIEIDGSDITKVNVSAGVCIFFNTTSTLENIQYKRVPFGPFIGVTPDFINTDDFTTFSIEMDGSLTQTNTPTTIEEFRLNVLIGVPIHNPNLGININVDNTLRVVGTNNPANIADMSDVLGSLNYNNGMQYTGNADLTFARSAGQIFRIGNNFKTNNLVPNLSNVAEQSPRVFSHFWRDGSGGFNTSVGDTFLNVDRYDDPNNQGGAIEPNGVVGNNKWQVFRILEFSGGPFGFTVLQHGTSVQNSQAGALLAAFFEDYEFIPQVSAAVIRGYVIARGGASRTDDTNDVKFKMFLGRFGIL